jgi:hypothetical protein
MERVTVQDLLDSADGTTIAVATTAVVYTKSFRISHSRDFGLVYCATSSGTVSLKIELEEGALELLNSEGLAAATWIEPEGVSDIESDLATETWHIKNLSPVVMPYGRFKITGGASNDASTTIVMKIAMFGEF